MNPDPEAGFELDARLATDTAFVSDWKLCRVLLMDDARFPWLVLVPRRSGLVEVDELPARDRAQLAHETDRAMKILRAVAACDKLNLGALGNIVRQLHVHVVARRKDDAAWPGPAWGLGPRRAYAPAQRDALLARLRNAG
ncbi:MAG TPA: HIT family protein [Rhodanobacteraceae bacterium]|nr:HIT family protein [Rhodanobacteraceae bacterium]